MNRAPSIGNAISLQTVKIKEGMNLHSNMFKAEITFIPEVIRCLGFTDQDDTFKTNAKPTIGIIAWFVGNRHAYFQWRGIVRCQTSS